jgi:hypothetical protein
MERGGLVASNGKIGRAIESGSILLPAKIALRREHICWQGFAEQSIKPSPNILDRFIELWGRNENEILSFAKTYGTLQRPLRLPVSGRLFDDRAREPLSKWRDLSKHAWELLNVAAALRDGVDRSFEEWDDLLPPERALSAIRRPLVGGPEPRNVHELRKWIRERVDLGIRFARLGPVLQRSHWPRTYLDAEIAAWNAELGPVSFGIEPDDEFGWRTVFDFGGSMLCYVGLQLMLVVAGGDIFTCSACHRPYIRPRGRSAPKGLRKAPKAGERNYCQDDECIRERNRLAAERHREHRRSEAVTL